MQPCCQLRRFTLVMNKVTQARASGNTVSLFEIWLQTDLQRRYDRALAEPVPEELLQLICQAQELGSRLT